MNKLLIYLKQEGLSATIAKVISFLFKGSSTTDFYCCVNPVSCANRNSVVLKYLTYTELNKFDQIKFFSHINGADYIESTNQFILTAYYEDEMVGYVAAEYDKLKDIHGLGKFKLNKDEAWVGPVYVCRKYRKKGVSSYLISGTLQQLKQRFCIASVYTCINADNISSIRSFEKNGFKKIGYITEKRKIISNNLIEKYKDKFKVFI